MCAVLISVMNMYAVPISIMIMCAVLIKKINKVMFAYTTYHSKKCQSNTWLNLVYLFFIYLINN